MILSRDIVQGCRAHAISQGLRWVHSRGVGGGFVRAIHSLMTSTPLGGMNTKRWRSMFERATQMSDGQIRFIGLSSMLVGLTLLLIYWR